MMRNLEVIPYVNVIQNVDGVWSVEESPFGKFISVDEKSRPKDICNKLVDLGVLSSSNMRTLHLTDISKDIIEIKEKKGMKPICRLKRSSC